MGRAPCCDKASVKKGPWSPEEDSKLKDYINKFGTGGNWIALPQKAGLKRCGKSCRLRWLNYLRPNIKHGEFSDEEDRIIFSLFATIGSRWSIIAAQLPGRTDNDIKNYWNTKLKKKLMGMIPPSQRKQLINIPPLFSSSSPTQISSQSLVPSQLSLSIPSLYKDFTSFSPYTTPGPTTNRSSSETSSSFTGLEFLSLPSNNPFAHDNSCTSSLTTLFQDQEGFLCPIPYDTSVKDHNSGSSNNMLVFGSGDQRSDCSSSDGTCNRQMVIDYGRDQIKQEQMDHHHHMHISSSNNNSYNNGVVTSGFEESHEQQQRVVGCGYANSGYLFGENNNNNNSVLGLGYDLEDVKRLISSSSSSLFSTDHESKTEEKAMAMYYF